MMFARAGRGQPGAWESGTARNSQENREFETFEVLVELERAATSRASRKKEKDSWIERKYDSKRGRFVQISLGAC